MESDDDRLWREHGEREGWRLPPAAAWPLRLPIIRTVRFVWLSWHATNHARAWGAIGIGLANIQPYDNWVLYAIARGKC